MGVDRRRGPRKPPSATVLSLARALAGTRIALGTALVAAPASTSRLWLGDLDEPAVVAVRSLGARDVVLGVGALVALRRGTEVRHAARWLEAGIVADLADAAATAVADELDARRPFAIALALSGAGLGAALRTRLR